MTVREGDTVARVPAIQAVLRSQVALAAKGNGPAQRALIKLVQEIESAQAAQTSTVLSHEECLKLLEEEDEPTPVVTDRERAQAILSP